MTSGRQQVPEQVQEPIEGQSSGAASEAQTVALMQQVEVEMPAQQGYKIVETRKWERIERRVQRLGRRSIDWLAAGWAFFGVAVTAGIALLVLPHATTHGEHLAPAVRPALWAAVIAGGVLWLAFAFFHFSSSHSSSDNAFDVCNEMRVARGAVEIQPPGPWWKKVWTALRRSGPK